MQNQSQLHGNSDAEINIFLENGRPILKKKFKSTKEVDFCVQMHGSFDHCKSPKIIRHDKYNVYMEYIQGKAGSQIIKQAEISQMRGLINGLKGFIEYNLEMSSFADVKLIRLNKLDLIFGNIPENLFYLKEYFDLAYEQISKQKNLLTPIGDCHGDLTFSNIVLDRTDFYFIDFLDGYLKSPIVDIAKLIQDLIFGWSFRYEYHRYDLRCRNIFSEITSCVDKSIISLIDVRIETLITILRIIPYVKDKRTEQWVSKTLERIANDEDFIYWK